MTETHVFINPGDDATELVVPPCGNSTDCKDLNDVARLINEWLITKHSNNGL